MNIFIVEDEVLIRIFLKRVFEKNGCNIIGETATGEEAIEMLKEHECDLICLDIKLQGKLDGIETAKKIREFSDTPIMFLSAYNENDIRQQIKISNCIGYFDKPIKNGVIKNVIEELKKD